MNQDFLEALQEVEQEKGISQDSLLEAIEMALISAYKKHFGQEQDARVTIDRETGEIRVYSVRTVVEELSDDPEQSASQIMLAEAQEIKPGITVGDLLEEDIKPKDFGRIAAQTAKQVVVQRIREAERGLIYNRYSDKENQMLPATVHRVDRGNVYIEVGRAEGIIPAGETVPGERYGINEHLRVFVLEVRKTSKGPQIVASRTHPLIIGKLFENEVPEIVEGIVEIKSIAREPGQRTKIAVSSNEREVDPVGACVGPRGTRIERVVEELGGEKIDVIPWSADPIEFIANALRPAKVIMVQINEDEHAAKVIVPDYQLSLAIGKEGQNARLAAKLTGWKIDIKSKSQSEQEAFGEKGRAGFEKVDERPESVEEDLFVELPPAEDGTDDAGMLDLSALADEDD
ncbi:MAG: transcription termination/antitermination protein NusA [Clostridia bacterium]|nr:transcription termination/antitermination protein NusA [Clostridia bacterium]